MSTARARTLIRDRWHWLIPAAVILGMLAPILFTDRTFASDWGNHLWLIWVQGQSIRELGEPTFFLQSSLGAFYPYFAFYGGSMYAVLGVVSWWTSPGVAVFLAYGTALGASYLGWTWIARQVGIRGWRVQLPGCIAVTAPFAVTNLYGRGDIPESIATAMLPLIAASGLSLIREPRIRLRDAGIFVAAIAALTGSHTLTLTWGTAFLAVCAGLLIACNWSRVYDRVKRCFAVAGLATLGVAINAWILMPLILYNARIAEHEPDPIAHTIYTEPEHLFSLFRDAGELDPVVTGDLNTQLPVLALLWALVCGAAFWRLLSPANRKLALGLLGLGGALLLLIMSPSLIEDLPRILRFIQFPYRLLTYVDFVVVALVTLALAAMERDRLTARIPVLALAAIALFNFGLSMDQNFRVRSWLSGREEALATTASPPPTWYAPLQFADGSAPITEPRLPGALRFPVAGEVRDSYAVSYPPGPAGTIKTNIVTGPYLVDVTGAKPVGRASESEMVVKLPASDRPRRVEVAASFGAGVEIGRWLTIVSLLGALSAVTAIAVTGTRRDRARKASRSELSG